MSGSINNENKNKILVVGSYNVDLSVKAKHLPTAGETVMGSSFFQGVGGKGANQAVAASRVGADVSFLGCVGEDSFGEEAMKVLSSEKIDISRTLRKPDIHTGTAIIMVDQKGENQIVVAPGANYALSPDDIRKQQDLAEYGYMLLQLEIPFESVEEAINVGKEMGMKIILNPAPAAKEVEKLLSKVDIFTPNETEAEILTGISIKSEEDAKIAADKLLESGVGSVLITMGSKGVYIKSREYSELAEGETIPAFTVEAVDTTGAGDCFNGALTAALSMGKPLKDAVRFASKAASISVTRQGAGSSMPYKHEIEV